MQPITYSLILNIAVLIACTTLAILLSNPWIVVIAVILQTHALERFRQGDEEEQAPEAEEEQPMGFLANVK